MLDLNDSNNNNNNIPRVLIFDLRRILLDNYPSESSYEHSNHVINEILYRLQKNITTIEKDTKNPDPEYKHVYINNIAKTQFGVTDVKSFEAGFYFALDIIKHGYRRIE